MARDRPVYIGPTLDVPSTYKVSMRLESTPNAAERLLGGTVRLVDVPAFRAGPAGVPRVNCDYGDTGEQSLVGDEGAQLEERPASMSSPLTTPNGYPVADALEVFEGDATSGAFGLGHETLTDAVVLDRAKAGLLAREFLQVPLGRLGAGLLQGLAEGVVADANGFDLSAGMSFAVGIDRDVADAEVNAKEALWVDGGTIRDVDGDVEEELAIAVDEVGLSTSGVEFGAVVGADGDRNDETAVSAEETDAVQAVLERVGSLVEREGAQGVEVGPGGAVSLVDFADLGNGANGVLCGEPKERANLCVVELLELHLVGRLGLEGLGAEPLACLVVPAESYQKALCFGFVHQEFDNGDQLHQHMHNMAMENIKSIPQYASSSGPFPPLRERRGFHVSAQEGVTRSR